LKALFIVTRASVLRGLDRFEGIWPATNVQNAKEDLTQRASGCITDQIYKIEKYYNELADKTFINCWHINKEESYSMWKAYSTAGSGIAIQTTVGSLKNAFREHNYIQQRKIIYIDNKVDSIPSGEPEGFFLQKRQCFYPESELRLMIMDAPPWSGVTHQLRRTDGGVLLPIDIKNLVEQIYVSPDAQKWFLETVQGLIDKYDIGIEARNSSI